MMFKFPYTSFEKINLDWIMKTLNQLKDAIPLVQQASGIYTQALETLASANAAVDTVTEQAAAAVTTANAASATATEANTTAAAANQRAAYAETDAVAAASNAQTALTAAEGAASTASAASAAASAAATATEWVLKGAIRKHTLTDVTTLSFVLGNIKSVLLVFAVDSSYGGSLNSSFDMPAAFIKEASVNGTTPYSASGLPVTFADSYYVTASQEFIKDYATFNVSYDAQTDSITITAVTDSIISSPAIYCRVYAR